MSGLSRETLELIASWAEMLTAAFGILAATAAVVYLLANKPLKKFEAHDNEVLRGTVADAQTALLVQKERADIAAGKLAGLEQGVATANTEMAKQQARAATAERSLLELQERVKPRRLTDTQSADFVAILSKFPNTALNLGWTAGGADESFNLLQQLIPLFKQAHWKVPETTQQVNNHLDIQVIGVALLIPGPEGSDPSKPEPTVLLRLTPDQTALQAALRAANMDLKFLRWYHTADGVPELVVGSKP
jgi:hypothetical protein